MDNTKLKSRLENKTMGLQYPVSEDTAETAITVSDSGYIALNGNSLDIIKENLKNQPMSLELFDIVKSPSGGSTVFTVPGLSGDNAEKELMGIILDYTTPRAYWDTPDPVEGTPPVCLSQNSIISHDGKACAHCPYNDFGSKDGETNAKACKESVLLFMLRPNNILPLLIRVPVTSKARFLKYTARLVGSLCPINGVVTKITLERATSKAGKPYALFNFEAISALTPEETDLVKKYAKQFSEIVSSDVPAPELEKVG